MTPRVTGGRPAEEERLWEQMALGRPVRGKYPCYFWKLRLLRYYSLLLYVLQYTKIDNGLRETLTPESCALNEVLYYIHLSRCPLMVGCPLQIGRRCPSNASHKPPLPLPPETVPLPGLI